MRLDLERSNASSSSVVFRGQMLNAAAQLQSALGIQDLGQVYYEPVKDQHGSTLITIINQIKVSFTDFCLFVLITKCLLCHNVKLSINLSTSPFAVILPYAS